MVINLAGLQFEITPADRLSDAEREVLLGLDGPEIRSAARRFRLTLVDEPPWAGCLLDAFADHAPAAVLATKGKIRVTHRRYAAEIDPAARCGRLLRAHKTGRALEVVLRVALSSLLPEEGGLPLHAAGVVLAGRGLVFFGPSGAGKSTLAVSSPHPVVSDELVTVVGAPFELRGAGFWGTMDGGVAAGAGVPLAALIELGKGPRLEWQALSPTMAFRRLVDVILVPAAIPLWSDVIAVLGRLTRAVPCYRMVWTPRVSPWAAIEALIMSHECGPRPPLEDQASSPGERRALSCGAP